MSSPLVRRRARSTWRFARRAIRSTPAARSWWTPVDGSSASSAVSPRAGATLVPPPADRTRSDDDEPRRGAGREEPLPATRDAPVGGKAVLEGVMMRGVKTWAVAVRKPAPEDAAPGTLGEIAISTFPIKSRRRRRRLSRLPVVRGVVALGESLGIGLRALGISANAQLP